MRWMARGRSARTRRQRRRERSSRYWPRPILPHCAPHPNNPQTATTAAALRYSLQRVTVAEPDSGLALAPRLRRRRHRRRCRRFCPATGRRPCPTNHCFHRGWAVLPATILVTFRERAKSSSTSATLRPTNVCVSAPSCSARRRFRAVCSLMTAERRPSIPVSTATASHSAPRELRQSLRGTDDPRIRWTWAHANEQSLGRKPRRNGSPLLSCDLDIPLHAAGSLSQRQFTQRNEIALLEEVLKSPLRLRRDVYFPSSEPLHELIGRDVDQLDLVGSLQYGVRQRLLDRHTCDLGDNIVEAFDVLDVQRRPHIDAGGK